METKKELDSSHCGAKPKKIAFGIAPLGIVSIGVVPMGIVSIGIVPMGVFSLGAVAMGIVNISIVGMGIISSGITTMGVWEYSPKFENQGHNHIHKNTKRSEIGIKNQKILFSSEEEAASAAEKLNCKGSHKMGDYWMPCE